MTIGQLLETSEVRLRGLLGIGAHDRSRQLVLIGAQIMLIVLLLVIEPILAVPDSSAAIGISRLAVAVLNLLTLACVIVLMSYIWVLVGEAGRRRDMALSEMQRRLELALEVSKIGLWDVDLETGFAHWDVRACNLFGVEPRDGLFSHEDWIARFHPDDRDHAESAALQGIEADGALISDYRVVWPGGEVRYLRDKAAVYCDTDGRKRLVGLIWDVTADKELQAEMALRQKEAEAANQAKSRFLAAMSHEIRTPLAGVIGMLDLMQAEGLSGEQAVRARIATASAQNLLQLLNDVLDFSRLEVGAMTVRPIPVEMRPAVREVTDLLGAKASAKGVGLTTQIATDLPEWMLLDPLRFRQILTNLVSNAITHTDAGHIAVSVRPHERGIRVEVSDTGIGIPAEDLGRIFDRFVQSEASISRQSGGTGLGLAISRELVGLMGGEIWAESELGAGSRFSFTLRAEACAAPDGRQPEPSATPNGTLDILVADDNATNRLLVSSILRKAGHDVTLVRNGQEAVDAVREHPFDVVLMDIRMPVLDGLAATRAIRALGSGAAETPIVALTANVQADECADYIGAGMNAVIAKPIDIAALNRTLAQTTTPPPPASPEVAEPTTTDRTPKAI